MYQSKIEAQLEAQGEEIAALKAMVEDLRGQMRADNLALGLERGKLSGDFERQDGRIAVTNTRLADLTSEVQACQRDLEAVQEAAETRGWEDDNLMTALRLATEAIITRLNPQDSVAILDELREQAAQCGEEPLGHEYYLEQIIEGAQAALLEVKRAA